MARRGARRTRWIALLFITCVLITLLVTAARAQEDEVAEGEEVFEDAGEEIVVGGEEETATEETATEAEPPEPEPEPEVEPEPTPEPEPVRVLPHYAQIAVKEIRARVGAADGTMGEVQKLSYPEKFAQPITVSAPGSLKLGFKVYDGKIEDKPPIAVNQAVLVFTDRETKESTSFVAEASKVGTYALDIDFSSLATIQKFHYKAGVYDAKLILGSFSTPNSLTYDIGAIKVVLPLPTETGYISVPQEASAGAGAQDPNNYKVLPEIKHVFRPDAKQAPFVVSLFFTAATLAPWLILVYGWQQLGFRAPLLTSGSFNFGTQALFVGALGALPVLMFLYWTRWNLFQLLGYLAIWGVYAFITGRSALREHAAQRAKAESGKAKKSE